MSLLLVPLKSLGRLFLWLDDQKLSINCSFGIDNISHSDAIFLDM